MTHAATRKAVEVHRVPRRRPGQEGWSPASQPRSDRQAPRHDYADAFGRSAERCGYDYEANYDAMVNALDLRGRSAFTSIRDEESFCGECIPYVETLTCAQLEDPGLTLPASCSMQLQR